MIIFNTTIHIEDEIHDQCLVFLKKRYIPMSIKSGLLHAPRLSKIYSQHEESGVSYSLRFNVKNVETLNRWMSDEGDALQQLMNQEFGSKAMVFITLMEEIEIDC